MSEPKSIPPGRIFLGLDVEGANHRYDTPLVAIGGVIWQSHRHLRRCFSIKVKREVLEKSFWESKEATVNGQPLFTVLQETATSEKAAMEDFKIFLDISEGDGSVPVTVTVDSNGYDLSHLNRLLHKHFDRLPLWFDKKGGYRGTENSYEQLQRHPHKTEIEALLNKYYPATHLPEDDADRIVATYILMEYGHQPPVSQFFEYSQHK